jgi:prevent-host-death family protein
VKIINIYEAKTHLSKLIARVMGGEEIVIGKSGEPVARLIPYKRVPSRREPGSGVETISISPDFDAPLPEEILGTFET